MFCILYENKNYLSNLWDDILAGEHIYPFDELNLGMIEHHNGSDNSEMILLYIDDEAGLCGSVVMKPLESDLKNSNSRININAWLLEDIRFHVKTQNSEFIYSSKIKALQMRFYKALKEACYKVMDVTDVSKVMTVSLDDKSHNFLKSYGDINFTKEYSSKSGIIGIIEKQPIVFPIEGNVVPFRLYG